MTGLTVEGLRVSYRGRPVLQDISLSAQPGEILAVVGPNGSGKSTLGKSVAQLIPIERGTITWQGESLVGQTPERVAYLAGYLFQNPNNALFARSVREEFNLGLQLTPQQVNASLDAFNLTQYAYRHPRHLSRGEKQRLALALLVARQANVVCLDEPFSALDPVHKQRLLGSLLDEARSGRVLLLITHDLQTVLEHATRVIGLDQGTISFRGTVAELQQTTYLADIGFSLPEPYQLLHTLREEGLIPRTVVTLQQFFTYLRKQTDIS